MSKVGIITYHSAYNYGSALQAYATQKTVEALGFDAEIINYRMDEQRRFYSMYRPLKYGVGSSVKDLMMLPVHAKRTERRQRFESFFSERFNLSAEFSEPEKAAEIWSGYDTAISGSDQIWNKHSCELEKNEWKYMEPYLLRGFEGKKVSYASSVANMTDDELKRILPDIERFDYIAMRERSSAERMEGLLGRPVENTLDPTFLLTKEQWKERFALPGEADDPYVLYYSLSGIKGVSRAVSSVKALAERLRCKLVLVTPFAWYPAADSITENHPEYGPVELLSALSRAKAVVTDSYHGTALSVNFGKDFYSLCKPGGSEFRKTDILEHLGLEERILYDPRLIAEKTFAPIDRGEVEKKLAALRAHSLDYLKGALL